jgi:hypothetical protein
MYVLHVTRVTLSPDDVTGPGINELGRYDQAIAQDLDRARQAITNT